MQRLSRAMITAVAVCGSLGMSQGTSAASTTGQPYPVWSTMGIAAPTGHTTPPSTYTQVVDCTAPGSCVVIALNRVDIHTPETYDTRYVPYAVTLTGASSRVSAIPLPSNAATGSSADARLISLTCQDVTDCVAVGYYTTSAGSQSALVATLSNGTWTSGAAPVPATAKVGDTASAFLNTVICPTAGWCAADGQFLAATGHDFGLLETGSPSRWTVTVAPEPSAATQFAGLDSIACPQIGRCTAVGVYTPTGDATSADSPLVVSLVTTRWVVTSAPTGPNAKGGTHPAGWLTHIACGALRSCVAVGSYLQATAGDQYIGLMETLSTGSWTSGVIPQPPGHGTFATETADMTADSVTCPAAGWCVITGQYEGATHGDYGFADTLDAGTWTSVQLSVPAGAPIGKGQTAGGSAVSCESVGTCLIVGGYSTTPTTGMAASYSLADGSWIFSPLPIPAGETPIVTTIPAASSVSCSKDWCAAVGWSELAGNVFAGWIDTTAPLPVGYEEVASDGGIFAFTAPFHGSMGGRQLNAPIVTGASDPFTAGYYELASDGGIFAFTAPFHGSMGGKPLNAPIVGMAFDTRTGGYYEVASDGGIFAFTAPFLGSMGGKPLNAPIVGMAFDPSTGGYWLVASDGGLFAFTAPFLGSMGGKALVKPIVGMTWDSYTGGYYEVASDGGLFAFTAPFHGSMGGKPLNEPIVAIALDPSTGGYWEVASDGGLFSFTAPFLGSMGGKPLNAPIVTLVVG